MGDNGEELTPQQERAIEALLISPTTRDAAEQADVPESTLYRWLRDRAFKVRYRQAQQDVHEHAMGRIHDLANKAVTVLEDIMCDPAAKESARVSAARTALGLSSQSIHNREDEERINALEQMIQQLLGASEEGGHG